MANLLVFFCFFFMAELSLRLFSSFFNKEVDVFSADGDPEQNILYSAGQLSTHFGVSKNRLGMYLTRRKHLAGAGIFQASTIVGKQARS